MHDLSETAPILERLRQANDLPSLPAVAVEVLRMSQEDDTSIAEIAKVLQQDPALTGKVLKVVNSPLFGMPRKISSLQQAMVVLGLRTVKVMALSFSLVDTMNRGMPGSFDYAAYWRRSLTTAVAARLLGERIQRARAEEAFIMGLLCDIGMLAASQCAMDLYEDVLLNLDEGHTACQEIEQKILGVTHEAMGSVLLERWGLPDDMCRAVGTHHHPIDAAGHGDASEQSLLGCVRAASLVADVFCTPGGAHLMEAVRHRLSELLPIDPEDLDEILNALDSHVRDTASLFSLEIGPTRDYQQLQAEAVVQLARLSVTAELERAQSAQREHLAEQRARELDERNRQLANHAARDALTGLGNRAAFERRLHRECSRAVQTGGDAGLILLDLDRFKKLNDTYGHQTGDDALRRVGACLNDLAAANRFPARYGGEEFAIVVSDMTPNDLREYAEQIRLAVHELRIPCGRKLTGVTVSVGVIHVDTADPALGDAAEIIRRADACLYEAKRAGRNRVVFRSSRQNRQPIV